MYKKITREGLFFIVVLFSGNLYSQSPGGIARQSIWMKGSFFQDSAQPPTLNFNPVTMLDKISPGIKFSGTINDLRRSTIFTVFQNPDLMQDKPIWQIKGGNRDLLLTTRQVAGTGQKKNLVFADSLAGLLKTGQTQSFISTYIRRANALPSEEGDNNDVVIQFGPSETLPGPDKARELIAEFIVYETILKDKDIARIETYLGLKYGITLQRNYLNSLGQIIWNRKEDKTYSNNIAGIGRDDQSALYQKQGKSSSASDPLIIGINTITTLNSNNTGRINDRDYLVWGDNAAPFLLDINNKPKEGDVFLSQRKWLMKSSGKTPGSILTQLKIDTRTLLAPNIPNQQLYLVIDRSGTGDFNLKDCSFILPDNISDESIASFNDVQWDTDASGKDIFTFGVNRELPVNENGETGKILSFQVYPNPITNGNYRVAVTLDKPAEVNIQIYDGHLRLVDSRKMDGQSDYLFSGQIKVAAGVYIIKLLTSGKVYSKILILQ